MAFTREQVTSIDVGTKLAFSISGERYSAPTRVTSITCRREDMHGKLFVHGYREHGVNGKISFSIKEGDTLDAKLYRIVE